MPRTYGTYSYSLIGFWDFSVNWMAFCQLSIYNYLICILFVADFSEIS